MTVAVLVVIIVLAGLGAWLLLDDDVVQIALGVLLLGHSAVLMLVGTRAAGAPPLLGDGGTIPAAAADPLPHALALTAIVISFGVTVLLLGLAARDADPEYGTPHDPESDRDVEPSSATPGEDGSASSPRPTPPAIEDMAEEVISS